ncbi:hypothetical protein Hanom_Chr06g00560461 [Helianthus anomalus]
MCIKALIAKTEAKNTNDPETHMTPEVEVGVDGDEPEEEEDGVDGDEPEEEGVDGDEPEEEAETVVIFTFIP